MNRYFRSDSSEATESAVLPSRTTTEKLYDLADTIMYIAGLNALMAVFTLLGGIIFGWSPAVAAAVEASRERLHHETRPLVRFFFASWRAHFLSANLLQAPGNILLIMLGLNYLTLRTHMPVIVAPTIVTAMLVVVIQIIAVTMDANYHLTRTQCLKLAVKFSLHFPAGSALLAAIVVLAAAITWWIPGLSLICFGATAYLCTALTLSFFSTNDLHLTTTSPTGLPL